MIERVRFVFADGFAGLTEIAVRVAANALRLDLFEAL